MRWSSDDAYGHLLTGLGHKQIEEFVDAQLGQILLRARTVYHLVRNNRGKILLHPRVIADLTGYDESDVLLYFEIATQMHAGFEAMLITPNGPAMGPAV